MACEITVQPTLITVLIHGEVTSEELLRYAHEVSTLETAAPRSRNLLTELRDIEKWSLTSSEMHTFAVTRAKTPLKNSVKSAIVAARDVDYGMARMFQMQVHNPKMEIMVFRDMGEAKRWLEMLSP